MENTTIDIAEANRRMRVGGRRLVSVRKIDDIEDIPNADLIKAAVIGGWKVVVKAGEFQPGDLCVFFEIDSFLPADDPRYEFLLKNKTTWMGKEGIRLRTIRLRRALSQGLALPLKSFPEIEGELKFIFDTFKATPQCDDPHYENMDFTDLLKVDKWEPPVLNAQLAGFAKGNFPSFGRKTDQERIENIKNEVFIKNKDSLFEVTLKLDGSSCSAYFKDGEVGVCSRNLELKLSEENANNAFIETATRLNLLEALKKLGKNIMVSSELLGPGIQGNRENLAINDLFVFDIFDIDAGEYLSPKERIIIFNKLCKNGFTGKHIPILFESVKLSDIGVVDVASSKEFVKIKSISNSIAEGCVFKRDDGQFSFKSINNDFLLAEK